MNPVTEAYEYGKRLGREYYGVIPMKTPSEAIEYVKNKPAWQRKILPLLRETAGYNNCNTTMPTVTQYDQRDCFRHGDEESKTLLRSRVIPAFWHGFTRGFPH